MTADVQSTDVTLKRNYCTFVSKGSEVLFRCDSKKYL